jgi:Amt family ammonium transporter
MNRILFLLPLLFFLFMVGPVGAEEPAAAEELPWTLQDIGDPSGAATWTEDVKGLKYSVNFTWTLICAFLVFIMQGGFAMLGGFLRARYMLNYLSHCFIDSTMGAIIFWIWGFALMFGGTAFPGIEKGGPGAGYSGWILHWGAYDVQTVMLWMFQMVFLTKAITIVAGGMAERTKFPAYLIYSAFIAGVVYPIYGHWVWAGNGWLATLPIGAGAKDFAGSGVVHAVGGIMAFVGAWIVGPRLGKFNPDGTPNAIPGHNLSFVVLGTFILMFGWFGFNPGSTLAATDLRISIIAVNTFLAACSGAVVVMFVTYGMTGKPDIGLTCNGALAGLVAITGPCAYVPLWAAIVIGIFAGLIMRGTVWLLDWVLHVDDPLGAVAVHGANGLWGLLALGLFADGSYAGVKGLITGSGWQLLAQVISMGVVLAWTFACGCTIFFILKHTIGLRVSEEVELQGVDYPIHGVECYPPDVRMTTVEELAHLRGGFAVPGTPGKPQGGKK